MAKKHPNLPLYHTLGKKSIAPSEKVGKINDSVENSGEIVEKSGKTVDKSSKSSGKLAKNSAAKVENPTVPVEKSSIKCGKPVQKPQKISGKPAKKLCKTKSQAVENSQNSTKKSVKKSPKSAQKPVVIKVTDLHKSFRLPTERASGLKQAILNWFKGIKGYTEHQVLKGVSFDVHQGEFIGIVGRNGSGKSTLLKLLAQIYYPESGSLSVKGTLVPFIELGVGFNPELTGRENVYLNGALLGFSRKEMDAMYQEIVSFAELEQFMDAKLKNYSSGMQVRLAFSIAIRAKGDILILDEVLAVGDAEFQKKCNDYFASLHGQQTVILVTHSMENVRRFCDRAILIEDGKVAAEGSPEEVATAYEKLWS